MNLSRRSGKNEPELLDAATESACPTPLRKVDLRDAHAIRREMASVYRDMRSGALETQQGTRLVYVLDLLRKAYETSALEARIEKLERSDQ